MKLPRLTIGRLMIVVVIVALGLVPGPDVDAGLLGYHDAMRRKYSWAAQRPWLPIAPDPPEPE